MSIEFFDWEPFGYARTKWFRCYYYGRGKKLFFDFEIEQEEYERFQKDKTMPIQSLSGSKIYVDDNSFLHNDSGYALDLCLKMCSDYYLNGVKYTKEQWEKKVSRRVIFSAQKIKTLKKLLYIPEIYENVFYDHKGTFISLLQKI